MSINDKYDSFTHDNGYPYVKWIVICLLSIHGGLLVYQSKMDSPTLNEPGHLAAGISYLEHGRFELYRVNPPLIRLLAAAPVYSYAKTDWGGMFEGVGARPIYNVSQDFIKVNDKQIFDLVTKARWACIPLSLLGAVVVFMWSSKLYGTRAGIWALILWCFSPTILGYGHLITCDMGGTALGVLASYFFWRWLMSYSWRAAILAGVFLGVALLAKTTLLIFIPLWPLMWLIWNYSGNQYETGQRLGKRSFCQMIVIFCLGIYVINIGYAFEGSLEKLSSLNFVSKSLTTENKGANRFANSWIGNLPVPLPKNYLLGIDLQKKDLEGIPYPSFLRNEFQKQGWWYYYLYGFGVKTPLGILLLLAMTVYWHLKYCRNSKLWRDEMILLIPAVSIFVLVSSHTGFSEHYRYILPVMPFLFIWISSVTLWKMTVPITIARIAICGAVLSSMWVYPHSLSYFNEIVGGPENGHNHMINSSIDWGQDLKYLKKWVDAHPENTPLSIAYYSDVNPKSAGIEFKLPPMRTIGFNSEAIPNALKPGWYLISVNFMKGYPWRLADSEGVEMKSRQYAFSYFAKLEPVDRIGYSIYVYHITENDIQRLKTE
ncbi:hypothetical protein Pan153_33070 [Gimesia panareensis]|uniref:Glycosyltransferase RgtA/B/C/D-like domain-containing protein n=1 Tax=Gimesia panareensis TaxID=2527978 RepID=A0A518FQL4_9PLAN|nr:glycosyltransferase family 39 protein [Gimesia panareensis]QDV18647.1 hypothetical protein Pan153_33070 [Gimesia panareensis]